jgi:hypothetical protein
MSDDALIEAVAEALLSMDEPMPADAPEVLLAAIEAAGKVIVDAEDEVQVIPKWDDINGTTFHVYGLYLGDRVFVVRAGDVGVAPAPPLIRTVDDGMADYNAATKEFLTGTPAPPQPTSPTFGAWLHRETGGNRGDTPPQPRRMLTPDGTEHDESKPGDRHDCHGGWSDENCVPVDPEGTT